MLYLKSMTNYGPTEKIAIQNGDLELVHRVDHDDGSVTINRLQRTPVQAGQHPYTAMKETS